MMSEANGENLSGSNPKQSPVRKGQHKPYIKATRQQIEQRIEAAALLHCCGFFKHQIHRVFRERYGVEWRQTDRYMARAHAEKNTSQRLFQHSTTASIIHDLLNHND